MGVERSAWGMGEDERQGSRGRVFRRPNWNQVMVAASESQARFAELARRQTAEVTPKSSGFSLLSEATAIASAVSPERAEKLESTALAPAYSAVQSVAHRSVSTARTQREYGAESRHERANESAARPERVSPAWRVSDRADVKVTGWEPEVESAAERYRAAPTWNAGTEPVTGTARAAIVSARELRRADVDAWYEIEDPFEDSPDFGYESKRRGQERETGRESNDRSGASAMLASGLSRWRSVWDSGVKLAERRIG